MTNTTGLLHHVEIYVTDLEKSTKFWEFFLELLGYTKFQKWSEGISWKLGLTYIVFVQTKQRYLGIPYHRCRTGLNHLAFHANSREQIDGIAKKLQDKGISFLYNDKFRDVSNNNEYSIFFEDPDRIKVELVYSVL